MKDNTSVLFREGTITESLPITGVTTFTIKLYNCRLLYNQMSENCYLLYSFKVGGTA